MPMPRLAATILVLAAVVGLILPSGSVVRCAAGDETHYGLSIEELHCCDQTSSGDTQRGTSVNGGGQCDDTVEASEPFTRGSARPVAKPLAAAWPVIACLPTCAPRPRPTDYRPPARPPTFDLRVGVILLV
jgi:hypothetical protein